MGWEHADRDMVTNHIRVVSEVTGTTENKHLQIANILAHSSGQILICCRWDHQAISESEGTEIRWKNGEQLGNSAEGDCSNEQVLFFSCDAGKTYRIANDGRSILTLALGTSFSLPSAVTHSLLFEDELGGVWLYYTVDQPMTCGKDYPWRATGGGEIRKILLAFDGETWRTSGQSSIIWGCMQPICDGKGGSSDTIRVSCLNAIIRLQNGDLLMPISGRNTLEEPNGCYWRENRSWVLRSRDGGHTWAAAHFVGGSEQICLCEGTVAETAKGDLVSLMRAGYNTGGSLFGSWSYNHGCTWSVPAPTGLPNTKSGARPYLCRLQSGMYLLLQTDEHRTDHRINLTAFVTDEQGLYSGRWKWKRVLCTDCRELWKGSAYGCAAQDGGGTVHIAFAAFTADTNRLYTLPVSEGWLTGCHYEPSGGMLGKADNRPIWHSGGQQACLRFQSTRGRAQAGGFGALQGKRYVHMHARVRIMPKAATLCTD